MIKGHLPLKGYEFSTFEEYLWNEAEKMIDKRFKWNRHKGSKFEAFTFLIFDFIVDTLGLKNKIRVIHNPFSYRKYVSREGLGIDLMIYYKKPNGIWTQLFAIECKDWQPRFMSPKVFLTHVWKRFENIIKPTKVLITKGIEFSVNTLTKIKNYNIKQITNNYVHNIRNLIINKLKINNTPINKSNVNNISKSVPVHNTQKNNITIPSQTEKFYILTLLTSCLIIQNRMKCNRKLVGG